MEWDFRPLIDLVKKSVPFAGDFAYRDYPPPMLLHGAVLPERTNIKPPGKCIFCNGGPLSKEHVWGRRLRKHLPAWSSHTNHFTWTKDLETNSETFAPGRLHRPGDTLSQTLRVVCRDCNHGWMRAHVQEPAMPTLIRLIGGEWPRINDDEARRIASWVTLFTMVSEFADPKTSAVSAEERREFSKSRTPLENWSFLIGRYYDWDPSRRVAYGHRCLSAGPAGQHKVPNVQTTAFILGGVLFYVFRSNTHFVNQDNGDVAHRNGLRVLWPTPATPIVRPDRVHNFSSFETLKNELPRRLRVSTGPLGLP